jgi:type I restriction enzyme S subunit
MAAVDEFSGTIAAPTLKPFHEVKTGFTWFAENDVIFAKITPCMQNGKAAIARGLASGRGFGSTEFHVLRPGPAVLPEWVWYFVRQAGFREEAKANFKGTAGQQRVPAEWLAEQQMPVPPMKEQLRIVERIREALARFDEIRGLRDDTRAEAAAVSQAARYEAFLSDAPRVELGSLISEGPTNGLYKPGNLYGSGTSILRINNFNAGDRFAGLPDLKRVRLEEAEARRFALAKGDFVINRVNGSLDVVGKACTIEQLNERTVFESNMMKFAVDEARVHRSYLLHFLASPQCRDQIKGKAKLIQQASINQQDVASFSLPLPPLAEQRRIAEQLDSFAARAVELAAELAHDDAGIAALPGSILRKAFAGEL